MAFDPKKWTLKTNEAFAAAIDQAKALSNPELTPDHLMAAMMRQDDTIVPAVLAKLGLAPLMVRNKADEAVQRLPKAYGGDEPHMNRELNNVVQNAETYQKDLKDDFLSVEHLLLAMNQRLGVGSEELLQALKEVRGSHRVTSQNPEENFAALEKYGQDLTQRARDGKIDPVIGRDDEIRRVIQVLSRRTKNNPVLIGEPGVGKTAIVEGLGASYRRRRRAGGFEEQATDRARHRLDAGRREVPRRVRGAAEGSVEGDHRRRRRGDHLRRRIAHHRRRRCRRGRDGRRQHDQADAGPRRAADDRRHDPRRVSQARREGRGARAAIPAGLRRRAERRGHHRNSAWPEGALRGSPRRADPGLAHSSAQPCCRIATSPIGSCPTRPST